MVGRRKRGNPLTRRGWFVLAYMVALAVVPLLVAVIVAGWR